MKVLTGEKDADATDSRAFDLPDVDDSPPDTGHVVATPEAGVLAPSPSEAVSDTSKPETASPGLAETTLADVMDLKTGRVGLNEHPDWSLVAKGFEAFIPECKTIEALKAFWNENSKVLEQFKAGSRDKEPLIPQPPSEADTVPEGDGFVGRRKEANGHGRARPRGGGASTCNSLGIPYSGYCSKAIPLRASTMYAFFPDPPRYAIQVTSYLPFCLRARTSVILAQRRPFPLSPVATIFSNSAPESTFFTKLGPMSRPKAPLIPNTVSSLLCCNDKSSTVCATA